MGPYSKILCQGTESHHASIGTSIRPTEKKLEEIGDCEGRKSHLRTNSSLDFIHARKRVIIIPLAALLITIYLLAQLSTFTASKSMGQIRIGTSEDGLESLLGPLKDLEDGLT